MGSFWIVLQAVIMAGKHNKCCCCPICTTKPGKCCACIPETICVTYYPKYGDPCSVELDFDQITKTFSGSIVCDITVDLMFYFYRDRYDGKCYFKLRSEALDHGLGYELKWEIGYEIDCETLSAESDDGAIEFVKVDKVTPRNCDGCKCLCECLCVAMTRSVPAVVPYVIFCVGKICWDYVEEAYLGSVTCRELENNVDVDYDFSIHFGRRGDYDPYADPYDKTCVLVLNIPGLGVVDLWREITPGCVGRSINVSFSFKYNYEDVTVDVRCAMCNELCGILSLCCNVILPVTLFATFLGRVDSLPECACADGFVVPLKYYGGSGIFPIWIGQADWPCLRPFTDDLIIGVMFSCTPTDGLFELRFLTGTYGNVSGTPVPLPSPLIPNSFIDQQHVPQSDRICKPFQVKFIAYSADHGLNNGLPSCKDFYMNPGIMDVLVTK